MEHERISRQAHTRAVFHIDLTILNEKDWISNNQRFDSLLIDQQLTTITTKDQIKRTITKVTKERKKRPFIKKNRLLVHYRTDNLSLDSILFFKMCYDCERTEI